MAIRELIQEIAVGWPAYRSKGTVDKSDPIYALVTQQLPDALRAQIGTYETILVQGSTGRGNITAAPWIGLFDQRLTKSATMGYYLVYLYATDLSSITLSLAFGTTQFEEQFGGPETAFPKMRFAAGRLQEMFAHLIPKSLPHDPIDLRASRQQKLHFAYEQASILSCPPYALGALPDDAKLLADLQQMLTVYVGMVSDPIEATVDRLVEAAIEPAEALTTITVRDFAPRTPAAKKADGSVYTGARYSRESRKVGDAGEKAVLEWEKDRLIKLGRKDLANQVRWHAAEGDYIGWDITSFDETGEEIYIEVKSCVGKAVSAVFITVNEWNAACHPNKKDRYYIYIVTNALSASPTIERLKNPAAHVEGAKIRCEPSVFELRLSPQPASATEG